MYKTSKNTQVYIFIILILIGFIITNTLHFYNAFKLKHLNLQFIINSIDKLAPIFVVCTILFLTRKYLAYLEIDENGITCYQDRQKVFNRWSDIKAIKQYRIMHSILYKITYINSKRITFFYPILKQFRLSKGPQMKNRPEVIQYIYNKLAENY